MVVEAIPDSTAPRGRNEEQVLEEAMVVATTGMGGPRGQPVHQQPAPAPCPAYRVSASSTIITASVSRLQ